MLSILFLAAAFGWYETGDIGIPNTPAEEHAAQQRLAGVAEQQAGWRRYQAAVEKERTAAYAALERERKQKPKAVVRKSRRLVIRFTIEIGDE